MYNHLSDVLAGAEANYMLPFYWQHGDHHDTIPEEIERIYQSGCRAFCVESRPHREFAHDGWWHDMDLILAEAKKRDMKVWIFDDDHFPTGHAVGVVKHHPEHRKWQLVERHVDVVGPLHDAMLMTDALSEDHILLGVFAYRRTGNGEECVNAPINLTDGVHGKFLHFNVPEGCHRVFFLYKSRKGTGQTEYIDMLSEESVKLLVEAVYETHLEHYGEHFGTTIAGFFSDEPSLGNGWYGPHSDDYGMYNRRLGMPGLALPWNDRVLSMMSETLGYDALSCLPALWFDMTEVTPDVRHAYMDAVTRLYRDCFTRSLGDWCEAHGVMYIGHIIEDMNAHARLECSGGHYFRSLDGQHMSGIDIVLHQIMPGMSDYIHTASTFGNNADPEFFDYVLAKLASSLAHIGTQMEGRAMCEVFGAYGWAEGAPFMKWLLDYLLVRGVNHFVPHAFSPSFPDGDCPPHFGANGHDPQFDGFSRLMTYGNRAAHLLSGGIHHADAAILYHADAEWMNRDGEAMLTQVPAKILYDAHIDFDILPADCFTAASGSRVFPAYVEDGRLRVGKQTYGCLIIPAARVLPDALEAAFEKLKNEGAAILRMGETICKCNLLEEVEKVIQRDITVCGSYPMLRCCHYRADSADIYMFVNESITETVVTDIRMNGIGTTRGILLDLLNDRTAAVTAADGTIHLELAPYQSVIAVFDTETTPDLSEIKPLVRASVPADLTFTVEIADYTDLDKFTVYAENVSSAELFNVCGYGRMPEFSGKIRYTCTFDRADLPADVTELDLGEVGQTARMWINGADAGLRVCPPYRFAVDSLLHEGSNTIVIEVANTLANALRDGFSSFMTIPASGVLGPIVWVQ